MVYDSTNAFVTNFLRDLRTSASKNKLHELQTIFINVLDREVHRRLCALTMSKPQWHAVIVVIHTDEVVVVAG